jgi:uncharacterized protein YcfL
MKKHWLLIIVLSILTSCGKQIPSNVLSPKEMESVLYDYHLAMAIFMHNHDMENLQKNAIKNYIFEKHEISSAEFDSSMVWYTREGLELCAIYERLEKRFKREHTHTESLLASRDGETSMITSYGDTVDIWRKKDIYWLSGNILNQQMSFEFMPDSNFHEKDAFRWNMDLHFFSEGSLILGMNVVYDNDSVIAETREVSESGSQCIYLDTDSAYRIRRMNGFIRVVDDSTKNPKVLINNISLMRYHKQEKDTLASSVSEP